MEQVETEVEAFQTWLAVEYFEALSAFGGLKFEPVTEIGQISADFERGRFAKVSWSKNDYKNSKLDT